MDTAGTKDPMALAKKKKKKDMGYMSKLHIKSHIDDACTDMNLKLLVADGTVQLLSEKCEEIMNEEYEEEIVRAMGGNDIQAASQAICTTLTENCSEKDFAALPRAQLALSVLPYGPLPITIQSIPSSRLPKASRTPQEKAMELAKEEAKHEPRKPLNTKKPAAAAAAAAAAATPSAPVYAAGSEEELAALQEFLDKQEENGGLTSSESAELLRRTYEGDETLLRCFRLNAKKGEAKLLSRMKLLLKTKGGAASSAGADVVSPATKEKISKANATPKANAEVGKLQDALGQLSAMMKDKNMDAKTVDKLQKLMDSTKMMAKSHSSSLNKDTKKAAEEAAAAVMDMTRRMKNEGVEMPDEVKQNIEKHMNMIPSPDEL